MPSSTQCSEQAPEVLKDINSVAELVAKKTARGVIKYGTCMSQEKVNPKELRDFLTSNRHFRQEGNWEKTQYVKLVCLLG